MGITRKELEELIYTKAKEILLKPQGSGVPEGLVAGKDEPTGLVFEDAEGRKHKALTLKEKLASDSFENVSVGKILRAKILGNYEHLNEAETKAAGEGIGSLGGWLVDSSVSSQMIDLARNLSCVQKAGALTMKMPTAEMRLVAITSDPTAYWTQEHGAITESDWTLAPINLKAVTLGVLVRSSIELLEDAPNAGEQLSASMSKAIALEMDRVALLGAGATEPRGIDNCGGISEISMGTNGAALTNYDELSNAIEDVADNNGLAGAIIMAPRTYFAYDRLKAATTNNRLEMPLSVQEIKDAGKIYHTNQIGIADTQGTATTASKVFVGDFKNILYGVRKNLEIEFTKSGGTNTFAKVEALIRCRIRLDVAVLRENHFTKIIGIIP